MIQNLDQPWEQELLSTGEARGRTQVYREVLRTSLRKRFGELSADVLAQIAQAELPALQAAYERIDTLTALADLQL